MPEVMLVNACGVARYTPYYCEVSGCDAPAPWTRMPRRDVPIHRQLVVSLDDVEGRYGVTPEYLCDTCAQACKVDDVPPVSQRKVGKNRILGSVTARFRKNPSRTARRYSKTQLEIRAETDRTFVGVTVKRGGELYLTVSRDGEEVHAYSLGKEGEVPPVQVTPPEPSEAVDIQQTPLPLQPTLIREVLNRLQLSAQCARCPDECNSTLNLAASLTLEEQYNLVSTILFVLSQPEQTQRQCDVPTTNRRFVVTRHTTSMRGVEVCEYHRDWARQEENSLAVTYALSTRSIRTALDRAQEELDLLTYSS